MTRKEEIIQAFRNNKYRMKLGQILCYQWGYKFTSRASDLRKDGYIIICQRAEKPSDNMYFMFPPDGNQTRFA